MKEQGDDKRVSGKKFLYTGPKQKRSESGDQWNSFTPRKTLDTDFDVGLDDVWSIKRNVTIGTQLQPKSSINVSSNNYYSRHASMKFSGDDISSSLSSSTGFSGSSGKAPSWSHSSRSTYSYMDSSMNSTKSPTRAPNNFSNSPPLTNSVPNKQNASSNRMMQTGGVPSNYQTGGRQQKNTRNSGGWMDF